MTDPAWRVARGVRPLHAVLLGGSLSLLAGALLSDWAYWKTAEIQWINFAAWLTVGALLVIALAWACALVILLSSRSHRASLWHVLSWLALGGLVFINALVHARDAWATMPWALWFSLTSLVLATLSTWLGLRSGLRGSAR